MAEMLATSLAAGEQPVCWVISSSDLRAIQEDGTGDLIVLGDGDFSFLDVPIKLVIGVTLPRLEVVQA